MDLRSPIPSSTPGVHIFHVKGHYSKSESQVNQNLVCILTLDLLGVIRVPQVRGLASQTSDPQPASSQEYRVREKTWKATSCLFWP